MTDKNILIRKKSKPLLRTFECLLESKLSKNDIIALVYPRRAEEKRFAAVICPNSECRKVNEKELADIENAKEIIEKNKDEKEPDFKCKYCRKRLIKRKKNKFLTEYNVVKKFKIDPIFAKSYHNAININLNNLEKLGLLSSDAKEYSINPAGVFQFLPFPRYVLGTLLAEHYNIGSREKELTQTNIWNYFLKDYFLQLDIKVYGSLAKVFEEFTTKFGSFKPWDFSKIFETGYDGKLSKNEILLLRRLQEECYNQKYYSTDIEKYILAKFNSKKYYQLRDEHFHNIKRTLSDEPFPGYKDHEIEFIGYTFQVDFDKYRFNIIEEDE